MQRIRQGLLNLLPLRLRFALRYMKGHKRFSLLLRPKLFSEKLVLRLALDRREILRICADKLEMRRYVEQKVGNQYLPKLLAAVQRSADINWPALPEHFVIKGSHGSGMVKVVQGWQPRNLDLTRDLIRLTESWLATDYGVWSREWAYVGLPRHVLIEEFIESDRADAEGVPWDFKFFVFNGHCAMIQVDTQRFSGHRRNLFSKFWQPMDCIYAHQPAEIPPAAPKDLATMVELAERIGTDIDFVRVDIYAGKYGPIVGELTMTPGGGVDHFSNPQVDRMLGDCWQMSGFRESRKEWF